MAKSSSCSTPQRPHTSDYIKAVFSDFIELHGDRQFADDQSIIGGIAEIEGNSVMVIGHEKGRETEDKVKEILACHSLKVIERQND